MTETARRAFIATLVFVGVVAAALALWELRVLVAVLLLAFIIAAAMRPTVDRLSARGVPPAGAIALHYLIIAGLLALLAWFVVPSTVDQLGAALGGDVPTSREELNEATRRTTGTTHDILIAIRDRLEGVPTSEQFVGPVLEMTRTALEILVGTFFVLAAAAYWIYERERAMKYVLRLVPTPHRKIVRDTWELVDAKLGAFVRGELLLVALVAAVLSASFWAIGLPYWLLLGLFAGVVELIPVIGPLAAGAAAVGVAYSSGGWRIALGAAAIVFLARQIEDYLVIPRVLGHAVGLSPLTVLVAVSALGLLLGGAYILLAIPVAAIVITLLDVIVRDVDPAEEEVPSLLFPAQDAESVGPR
jgi:predicted PurR-regulated permease PerM